MTPRLLVDENFPAPSTSQLRDFGWDVVAVGALEPGASDQRVMDRAREEGRWLVTFDADFGALIFERRLAPPPSVLLLRVASYRPAEPAAWIVRLYSVGQLRSGAFHVFNGRSIRRRRFVDHGAERPG